MFVKHLKYYLFKAKMKVSWAEWQIIFYYRKLYELFKTGFILMIEKTFVIKKIYFVLTIYLILLPLFTKNIIINTRFFKKRYVKLL